MGDSSRDVSGRASEILDQWRRDQQQQTEPPRLSLVSVWASPMTAASSNQGGITLVTDPDETDVFSEGHSLELDETVIGGRRLHTLRQQLLTALRQKEEIEIAVQRGLFSISNHIDEVTALCHNIAGEEFPTLVLPWRHSPKLRSRVHKSLSPSYSHLASSNKLEEQPVYQHIATCLEHDIPQSIHALQTAIRDRVAQVKHNIEQLQQDEEQKRSEQLHQWNNECEQRRKQMESSQQELESIQNKLKDAMERLKQAETLWTLKQKESEDIDILCEQRIRDIDILQHKAQDKRSQLAILEASLYSQREELKLERKTMLQQKTQLEQDLKNFKLEFESYEQKRQDMMIVQTELLELQVLQQTKQEDMEQREHQLIWDKQTLQDMQSQIHKERDNVQIMQRELDQKTVDWQTQEQRLKRDQDNLTDEQDQFSQRLEALEQREKELEQDRSDMQKIQTQFAKAVSLAKTDVENQRLQMETMQNKFIEEQRTFFEERECQRKWIETVTQTKIIEEQERISQLKKEQSQLNQVLNQLRDDIDKYRAQRDEHANYVERINEAQIQYTELQLKVSKLDDTGSRKEKDLQSVFDRVREEENKVKQLQDERRYLQDDCEKFSQERNALKACIEQLTKRLESSEQDLALKDEKFKMQCNLKWEGILQREGALNSQQEELRLKEEKIASEDLNLERRQAKLHETESKLAKIAQILKAREKAVTEREEKEKTSREGDLKHLIVQLKDMIEMEKQRFRELLEEKERLEEESLAKDVALKHLQDMCLTEAQKGNADVNPFESQLACARFRQLALCLKQKDDDLEKDREMLQVKLLQCVECERSLIVWQQELESLASSLIQTSKPVV